MGYLERGAPSMGPTQLTLALALAATPASGAFSLWFGVWACVSVGFIWTVVLLFRYVNVRNYVIHKHLGCGGRSEVVLATYHFELKKRQKAAIAAIFSGLFLLFLIAIAFQGGLPIWASFIMAVAAFEAGWFIARADREYWRPKIIKYSWTAQQQFGTARVDGANKFWQMYRNHLLALFLAGAALILTRPILQVKVWVGIILISASAVLLVLSFWTRGRAIAASNAGKPKSVVRHRLRMKNYTVGNLPHDAAFLPLPFLLVQRSSPEMDAWFVACASLAAFVVFGYTYISANKSQIIEHLRLRRDFVKQEFGA